MLAYVSIYTNNNMCVYIYILLLLLLVLLLLSSSLYTIYYDVLLSMSSSYVTVMLIITITIIVIIIVIITIIIIVIIIIFDAGAPEGAAPINLFGSETLKLKIRRLKLWKPGVMPSEASPSYFCKVVVCVYYPQNNCMILLHCYRIRIQI